MSRTIALGLIRDLFFRAKVDAVAAAVGAEVEYVSSLDALGRRSSEVNPSIVFVDLSDVAFPAPDTMKVIRSRSAKIRAVGFASHVDVKTLKAARDAGFELTLSRSEFTAQLPELLKASAR